MRYADVVGIKVDGFGPRALLATVANDALAHDADVAKVQQWLEHANISTTAAHDRPEMRAEDSPKFSVIYCVVVHKVYFSHYRCFDRP
ncbi:site-specific integrase [Massilia pinisoli]|uniref:Site-specific integrase n=1 Tax=Massilia pinisoli TaxID=1772194 RepID=A0ABT1ZTW8_9BURK|nr:site-specific integrase [Massilia pinisoli]MCS0583395.1 site-specific integrase [Massilia pinisoli]